MADRLQKIIGTTLRRERELHRLTQAQLAARAGVSQATVARVETGDRSPSLAMVGRLLAVLGSQLTVGVEPLDAEVD
ncbi:helix-turn-helix domain-containing protein [Plantactinospora siamensis]|uniref:Helix-turn-helix domain-containing protein n=1 Tax=Plantactinospora siamensis TaxID=555372 RepID=A0ABV6NPQ7_9ACTN